MKTMKTAIASRQLRLGDDPKAGSTLRSLAASVRFHPFRGRLRTIAEIAAITGHASGQIDDWIRRGVAIPLKKALASAPLEDSFASCCRHRHSFPKKS
jgi:hypothetical protein